MIYTIPDVDTDKVFGLRIWSSVGAFGLLSIIAFVAFARMLSRSFEAGSAKAEGD